MNVDDIDVQLILSFLEGDQADCTVVDIVKELFQPDTREDLIKKVSMTTYRLKKWVLEGIFQSAKINNTTYYELNQENVHYGDSQLIIGEETIFTGKSIALQVKSEDHLIVCFLRDDV